MPTRQSVQCVLVMACALGVAEADALGVAETEGTSQERSQTVNAR